MNRRKFLSTLACSGSTAWLTVRQTQAAITEDSAYRNPVPFAQDAAAAGLDPAEESALFTIDAALTQQFQGQTYPQSVASGDPRVNGIVLWTRVDPSAQTAWKQIAFQIASDPGFTSVIVGGTSTLSAATDNTVKLPIANSVLQPFTAYYYRFIYDQVASRTGRFKTLPAAGMTLARVNLGYVVCQDLTNGYYTALAHLAREDVDYVVHLGDYVYETIASNFPSNPVRTVPPFPSGSTTVPINVDDYRHLYKVYRGDPNLQAAHENFAYIQLWDDHEFANDCHQDYHPDNNAASVTEDTPQPDLRQAANQAWSEYGLADVIFNPTNDWEHSIQVYRKFSFGSLADLIVTDERLYRDGPPCGDSEVFGRYFSIGCAALRDSHRTMLGSEQKQWFLDQVTHSTATWKLWANEVMVMELKAAGFVYVDLDQWDGYPKERSALLGAIKGAGVKNFIALTGDHPCVAVPSA